MVNISVKPADPKQYPLCAKRGLCIVSSDDGDPDGIQWDSLHAALTDDEKQRLSKEAWTFASNGAYPYDVERFLAGLPTLD